MSLPTFAFSSTGEEVANAFAQEILGKNGDLHDCRPSIAD
jgi:hypothetical protein